MRWPVFILQKPFFVAIVLLGRSLLVPVAPATMAEGVEAFTLLALMLVIIILRIFVRWRRVGLAHLQLDDYLMVLAGVGQDCFAIHQSEPRLSCDRYSAPLSR